jgi:hypothetical protein
MSESTVCDRCKGVTEEPRYLGLSINKGGQPGFTAHLCEKCAAELKRWASPGWSDPPKRANRVP